MKKTLMKYLLVSICFAMWMGVACFASRIFDGDETYYILGIISFHLLKVDYERKIEDKND